MRREKLLRLTLLLLAAALRLWLLGSAPPGLTHDEADHGLSAWGVVQGERPLYFTVGYGREPLYDYATAGLMALLGPTYFAGRLTSVFFSLLTLAATYAFLKRIFSTRIALLTLAGLAVGFWPLMTARHALRTVTMPFFFVLAVYFWSAGSRRGAAGSRLLPYPVFSILFPLFSGLFLGLSFYTYFPARVMWLLFPGLLGIWAVWRRPLFARLWRPTLVMLLVAAAVAAPLAVYLWQNPEAEQRLGQLTGPLEAAREGDFAPLAENFMAGIRLIPFKGDTAWRYNIPERPLLSPFLALLSGVGLLLTIAALFDKNSQWSMVNGRRSMVNGQGTTDAEHKNPNSKRTTQDSGLRTQDSGLSTFQIPLLLLWLLLALAPVFVTGVELASTRAIAVQPILYVFPAIALSWMMSKADPRSPFAISAIVLLFAMTGLDAAQRYFIDWARHPEVRVQYESTTVAAVDYLNVFGSGAAAISSTTPDRFHSQPIGLLTLTNPEVSLSWFDGRHALYVPNDPEALLLDTGFAPLDPDLRASFLEDGVGRLRETLPLRPDDLDRPLRIFEVDGRRWQSRQLADMGVGLAETIRFGDLLDFGGRSPNSSVVAPGEELVVTTLWLPQGSQSEELVLFTQLLGPDGLPLAQADRLDAPAASWRAGDAFLQRHLLAIPADAPPGAYPLIAGVYRQADLTRLPLSVDGLPQGDFLQIDTILVGEADS